MNKYDEMKKTIEELIEEGKKLYIAIDNGDKDHSKDLTYFIGNYERWYSKALVLIKQLLPNRINDFVLLYKNDKQIIDNNMLAALTLLRAESNPKEKNVIVDLVMNFLNE